MTSFFLWLIHHSPSHSDLKACWLSLPLPFPLSFGLPNQDNSFILLFCLRLVSFCVPFPFQHDLLRSSGSCHLIPGLCNWGPDTTSRSYNSVVSSMATLLKYPFGSVTSLPPDWKSSVRDHVRTKPCRLVRRASSCQALPCLSQGSLVLTCISAPRSSLNTRSVLWPLGCTHAVPCSGLSPFSCHAFQAWLRSQSHSFFSAQSLK